MKKKHKRAIVIPDQHFPIHSQKALNVVKKAIRIIKPDIFVNLGDVGEWGSVSQWNWKRKKKPPLEYQLPAIKQEIKAVNSYLDQIDRSLDWADCNERYILAGNHDEWLDSFVESYPYIDGYTFREACRWDKRGYEYYPYNKPLKIGKLVMVHGSFCSIHHAKKHLQTYGCSILYGHTHDIQRYTMTRYEDGTIGAWSLGCLKDMSPEANQWLRGRLNNWGHAFAVVDFFTDGNFKIEVVEIINGKTALWGEILEG